MKYYFYLLMSCFYLKIKAQNVGINATGNTPNSSAMLDVDATNKGLLIPRVSLVNATDNLTITSPTHSLLVYNTNSSTINGLSGSGYYYNSGTTTSPSWKKFNTDNSWNINGNSGIVDGTHFIGTKDSVALNFKVKDLAAGRIEFDSSKSSNRNTFFGFLSGGSHPTAKYNVGFGCDALFSLVWGVGNVANGYQAMYSSISGYNNVANGHRALYSNINGYNNIDTGSEALYSNIRGNANIALGTKALYGNTYGNYNVANGFESLYNNKTGIYNIASGFHSLNLNDSGNNNIGIGYNSGYSLISGDNNIFIGYNTNPNISNTESNQLNIGNWIYGDSGKIGIGTIKPLTQLTINGVLNIEPKTGTLLVNSDNFLITVGNESYISLAGDGAASAARTITLSNGLATGQILFIENTAQGIEVADNATTNNTNVTATHTLATNDIIQLIWNETAWLEVSFSNN